MSFSMDMTPTMSDRRTLLGGLAAMTWAMAPEYANARAVSSDRDPAAKPAFGRFAYVGCRTSRERHARGKGIEVYRIDPVTGAWSHVQRVDGLVNPSFLCFDETQSFLYAVHGDESEVSAFAVDQRTGLLTRLNTQSTQGRNPVHLTTDPANRELIIANYASGAVAVLPRLADGSLGAVKQLEALPGTPGPIKDEQSSSHPHEIAWDHARKHLIVPDKGLDRLFTFTVDDATGRLVPGSVPFVQLRPGTGPRHVAFHPTRPFAFVSHELASGIGAYRYDPATGALTPMQFLPSIPGSYTGANTAAGIAITHDGAFVYVSNRGHNSIGCFRVGADGHLRSAGWTLSDGMGPRFIALDPSGTVLHAANELSDTIVPFHINPVTGTLTRKGEIVRTGSPVCVVYLT